MRVPTPGAIRDTCLCLAVRKAARGIARRYDDAFRPFGITSGQFSILAALAPERPIGMSALADALGMDRTTLTAALKPLAREGLVAARTGDRDRRMRRYALTEQGRAVFAEATAVWSRLQDELGAQSPEMGALRRQLASLG